MQPLDVRPDPARRIWARLRPVLVVALAVATIVAACGSPNSPAPAPSGSATAVDPSGAPAGSPSTSSSPAPSSSNEPAASSLPSASPAPTPVPTPVLVAAPLTGVMVRPKLAARHPIAVMIDDHWDARPQSGFTQASVVWQAPAEGGIPRYMMVFAEGDPTSVGPVRSARLYFVQWASEWKAAYVHVGGSPQAMAVLRSQGQGQLVYDADQFRWGGTYLWRTTDRFAPHNVYSDGKNLRSLAKRIGATSAPRNAAWKFADDADLAARPKGARIDLAYPYNKIGYRYNRQSNTWDRLVGGKWQVDRASKQRVAPKNVVIMQVAFGLLGNGQKGRLEAGNIGSGPAWIATNGKIVKGTWKKPSAKAFTRFYDRNGKQIVLTRGQTFIQVIPPGTPFKIVKGTPVATPAPGPTPTPTPQP